MNLSITTILTILITLLFQSCVTPSTNQQATIPEKIEKQAPIISESNDKLNIPFGEINGYDLIYDCIGCTNTNTNGIIVYARKDSIKTKLFVYYEFEGDYLDEISLRYFDNHPFIYIHSNHTYGHSNGELYALDIENLKTNTVNKIETGIVPGDSLYIRNYFGLTIKDNEFLYGAYYRSNNGDGQYSSTGKYNLIKVKGNIYLLEPKNDKLDLKKEY